MGNFIPQEARKRLPGVVREEMDKIVTIWKHLWGYDREMRRSILILLLAKVWANPDISFNKEVDYADHLLKSAEEIKQRASGPPSRGQLGRLKIQESFIADLQKGFKYHFHEDRDKYGLGAVDNLNLSLRLNLFLSHYSKKVTRQSHKGSPVNRSAKIGIPFYPFMALVQSSGSGKSRLLREVGTTLPVVYGNLNASQHSGYPFADGSLRETSDGSVIQIDSEDYRFHVRSLLLMTVIVFYVLFSCPKDKRKRITLPEGAGLRAKSKDMDWRPGGICEHDIKASGTGKAWFWDAIIDDRDRGYQHILQEWEKRLRSRSTVCGGFENARI